MPGSRSRLTLRLSASTSAMAMWTSWPQACITPFRCERNGRSEASVSGSPSMSALTSTDRPGSLPLTSATTPVPTTWSLRLSSGSLPRYSARYAPVLCSWNDSSGCACSSRRTLISLCSVLASTSASSSRSDLSIRPFWQTEFDGTLARRVSAQARLRQDAGARRSSATNWPESLRGAEALGHPTALRLSAGDGRRPGQLGYPQGSHPQPGGAPAGGPRRRPPGRLLRFRGPDPQRRIWRRHRHGVGLGDL